MENFQVKRKSAVSASLSPRDFRGGVVGLGIVAAMTGGGSFSASPRSSPIPIVSSAKAAANFRGGLSLDGKEIDESSESYTCVISRCGAKRVYFDGKLNSDGGGGDDHRVAVSGVFSASPDDVEGTEGEFWTSDFLSSCFLCKKQLDGLDIFIGEKAFCSWDCRDKHIWGEDYKENCSSEAMKPRDYSASPCSSPRVFFAGVAAA